MQALGLQPIPPLLHEPPACFSPFSATVSGQHYLWGGGGLGIDAISVHCFSSTSEHWTQRKSKGTPHPGKYGGPCTSLNGYLYMFGGLDETSYYNALTKLNTESMLWSLEANNIPNGECPMRKFGCGLLTVNNTTLCCIAGCGLEPTKQPRSAFTKDTDSSDGRGCTNECHMFDAREGIRLLLLSKQCSYISQTNPCI